MRRVRRKDTGAELMLRKALWRAGLRYRKHPSVARSTPDVAFLGRKVAVFVDGCFWHGCPLHYVAPVNNAEFWRRRLRQNQERDARDDLRLQSAGWTVLRFWECEIVADPVAVVTRVKAAVS
jgi:DNA mismatch endonuclease (patch repair protein)